MTPDTPIARRVASQDGTESPPSRAVKGRRWFSCTACSRAKAVGLRSSRTSKRVERFT